MFINSTQISYEDSSRNDFQFLIENVLAMCVAVALYIEFIRVSFLYKKSNDNKIL